jgi:hypothetical protein
MDLLSQHIDSLRAQAKLKTNQNRLMQMIQPDSTRPHAMLRGGGGLGQSGGIKRGGGLMYGNAGNGMADFGQGYHPELRKIMKADDKQGEIEEAVAGYDLFSPDEQKIPFNEEEEFVAEAEAPKKVEKVVKTKKLDKSHVVVQGDVREIRTNNKVNSDVLPKAGVDYVPSMANTVQKEVMRKAMEKAGDLTPFKARGNKQVVVVNEAGEITKYTSLIKAHKSLGLTKHQLTGGKTPKTEFDSHYSPTLKSLISFMSKNNVKHFD